MSELTTRNISDVTVEIHTIHKQAQQFILTYAIEIGRRLVEAKNLLEHGEWGEWLKNEIDFSQRTASNFMRMFEEYGAVQIGILGAEANSQALANLSYTKALALLTLPADEREEFVNEHDSDDISTRDFEKLIAERAEAIKAKEDAEARARELEDADEELARLRGELEELRSRPIDVAVQKVADPEAVKEAVTQAEEKLKKKIEKAEKSKADAEERLKALEAAEAKKREELEREKDEAVNLAAGLEKKLALANPAAAEFKVHFEAAQASLDKLLSCIERVKESDELTAAKLTSAVRALVDKVSVAVSDA